MEKIILETPTSPGENDDIKQITLRKYSENDYNFVYEVKKNAYKKYVEECWGNWDENAQREYFKKFIDDYCDNSYIIQYDGNDIGFYNDEILEDGSYEIGNICIIPEYQGKGIGTQVLENMIQAHENLDIHIQYFKQNPVGNLYKKLGFDPAGETDYHFQMVKKNGK